MIPALPIALVAPLLLALATSGPETAPPEPTPVLVELFTSEGCSSCPPADTLVAELARKQPIEGVRVVPLGYHVTYWDRLGWRDRFSAPAWTERQESYARALGLRSVYTPQAVVDGRSDLVASRRGDLIRTIAGRAGSARAPLDLETSVEGDRLSVRLTLPANGTLDGAEAWVALAEDGLATDVARGENKARRLRHVAVVRARASLGSVSPGSAARRLGPLELVLDPDWRRDRLTIVAVVQRRGPAEILALATRPLPPRG